MALTTVGTVLTFMGQDPDTAKAIDIALAELLVPIAIQMVKDEVGYEIELNQFTEYHPEMNVAPVEDELIEGWEVIGGRAVPRGPRGQKARAILQLRNLPVRTVDSVYEAPAAWDTLPPEYPAGTLLQVGQHYRVDFDNTSFPGVDVAYPRMSRSGHLIRRVGIWSPVGRSVKVTYTAGYTDDELAGRWNRFKVAAMMTGVFFMKEAKLLQLKGGSSGIITGEAIDGWSQSFQPLAVMTQLGMQYALPMSVKRILEQDVRMTKFITQG